MPRSSSTLPAFSMTSMSDFEPMMIPTRGASASSPASSVLGLRLRIGSSTAVPGIAVPRSSWSSGVSDGHARALHGPQRDVASQLPALEGDPVGGSIGGVAGVGRRRAERRDVEHAPAGGHEVAVGPSAVPACVTSTSPGRPSSPAIRSPVDADSG